MPRYVIITAYAPEGIKGAYELREDDIVICADGGYALAKAAGIKASLVLGDFDSGSPPDDTPWQRVPPEKDDTDTMLCLKHAIKAGAEDILLVGGMGGRLDHTLSNLQTLAYASKRGVRAAWCARGQYLFLLEGPQETFVAHPGNGYLSLLAFSPKCTGVCVSGVAYPLDGATLTSDFPLGVSNVITGARAKVSVVEGTLAVIVSHDA